MPLFCDMITYGIIPRSYGLAYQRKNVKMIFPPSKFAEAVAHMWSPATIRKKLEEYSPETQFSDLEEAVKASKGSYKLIRNHGIANGTLGGLAGYVEVETRRPANRKDKDGRRPPSHYLTALKGIVNYNEKTLGQILDMQCGCKDFTYSAGRDEARDVFRVACEHVAVSLTAVFMDVEGESSELKHCKPLTYDNTVIPYDFISNNHKLVIETLVRHYIKGEKYYDIDVDFLENHFDEIVTPMFKDGIKRGNITFEVVKHKEDYPEGARLLMRQIERNYLEGKHSFRRDGIVRESDGNCYWNWTKGDIEVRVIPGKDEWDMPKLLVSKIFPKAEKPPRTKRFKSGIDPRLKKPRIFHMFDMTKDTKELELTFA